MSNVKSKQYEATLVRGETYAIGKYIFLKRKPQVIDAETKAKLEISAIDRYTMTGSEGKEVEIKQKFLFKEVQAVNNAVKVKTRAEEIAEMQGDGGVEFDEDAGKETKEDEYSVEEDESGAVTKTARTKVTSGGGAKRQRR